MNYKVNFTIKGVYNITFKEEQISLGTQIKETLDKSHDTGGVEVLLLKTATINDDGNAVNTEKEFQAYTPVLLSIYTLNEDNTIKESVEYNMLIAADDVIEVFVGDSARYTHKLSLIDKAKLLETELMPNITFTQPLKRLTPGVIQDATDNTEIKENVKYVKTKGLVSDPSLTSDIISGVAMNNLITGSTGDFLKTLLNTFYKTDVGSENVRKTLTVFNTMQTTVNGPADVQNLLLSGYELPQLSTTIKLKYLLAALENGFVKNSSSMFLEFITALLLPGLTSFLSKIKKYQNVSFTIYPSKITLINKTDGTSYNIGSPVLFKDKLAGKWNDRWCVKYSYYGIVDAPVIPNNLTEGEYAVLYEYNLTELYVRNFNSWPFSMPWEQVDLTQQFEYATGKTMTLRDILSVSMLSLVDDLRFYESEASKFSYIKDKPYLLSELMTKIENQISARDSVSLNKTTPTLVKGVVLTENGGFVAPDAKHLGYASSIFYKINTNFNVDEKQLFLRYSFKDSSTDYPVLYKNLYSCLIKVVVIFYDANKTTRVKTFSYTSTEDRNLSILNTYSDTVLIDIPDSAEYYRFSLELIPNERKILTLDITPNIANISIDSERTSSIQNMFRPAKYKFSDHAKSLGNIASPEFTFNGKTLWEICLELGEIFKGIPTLNTDNEIDFYIPSESENKTIGYDLEPSSKRGDMQNYASKLYTPELKNIVFDNNTIEETTVVYPAPNEWIAPRANDANETIVDRQTTAIVIQGPNANIYKVKKVLVQCPIKVDGQSVTKEYDITEYVLEKKVWDSLSDAIDVSLGKARRTSQKGTYLYYEQGKNLIMNIAQLPKNASLIGWQQEYMTIQFLLKSAYQVDLDNSSNEIFNYKFRVEYVPYYSRLNITRQSNLSDTYNQITANFNQTSNNVSSMQWSKFAENTVSKMGPTEYITSYTTTDLVDNINIGDCIPISGQNYYVNSKVSTYGNIDRTVTLSLTKDNYKVNDRIAISKEYRQYNIPSQNIVRKTINKPYTILIGNKVMYLKEDSNYIRPYSSSSKQFIARSIVETLDRGSYSSFRKISNAFVSPMQMNEQPLPYNVLTKGLTPAITRNMIMPVMIDTMGNTITMQFDMYDYFAAGIKIRRNATEQDKYYNTLYDIIPVSEDGKTKYIPASRYGVKSQTDVRYCNDMGECPKMFISFFSRNADYDFGETFYLDAPETEITKSTINNFIEGDISYTLISNKDSREAISVQTTISAQTYDKDIIIGDFLKYNPMVTSTSVESMKWYGYTEDFLPNGSYYIPNPSYALTSKRYGPYEYEGNPYVYQIVSNKTTTNFKGIVLMNSTNEIALIIKKPLNTGISTSVYFNIFDDEVSLSDLTISEEVISRQARRSVSDDVFDLEAFSPTMKYTNNKFYVDLTELEDQGLNPADLQFSLVTRHNSKGRGISYGYNGRTYRKHNAKSLYSISNNYTSNPFRKEGSKKTMSRYLFNTILADAETGELYYFDKDDVRHNLYDYLSQKMISIQDFGGKKKGNHATLKYGIAIKSGKDFSGYKANVTAVFDTTTRLPISFSA